MANKFHEAAVRRNVFSDELRIHPTIVVVDSMDLRAQKLSKQEGSLIDTEHGGDQSTGKPLPRKFDVCNRVLMLCSGLFRSMWLYTVIPHRPYFLIISIDVWRKGDPSFHCSPSVSETGLTMPRLGIDSPIAFSDESDAIVEDPDLRYRSDSKYEVFLLVVCFTCVIKSNHKIPFQWIQPQTIADILIALIDHEVRDTVYLLLQLPVGLSKHCLSVTVLCQSTNNRFTTTPTIVRQKHSWQVVVVTSFQRG